MSQECNFGCMITDGWRTSMKQGKLTNCLHIRSTTALEEVGNFYLAFKTIAWNVPDS